MLIVLSRSQRQRQRQRQQLDGTDTDKFDNIKFCFLLSAGTFFEKERLLLSVCYN
jgi:hypothetical protein